MSEVEKRRAALRLFFEARPRRRNAICKKAGVSESTVRAFMNGETQSLEMATYDKLATAADVPVAVLLGETNDPGPIAAFPPANARPLQEAVPDFRRSPLDLPIMGTAECGPDGEIEISGPVDHVARPPALAGNRMAYAIYAAGDSMEPRVEAGDLLIVDPTRHVKAGDLVVAQIRDGEHAGIRALIKLLVKADFSKVVLRQANPEKAFTLDRKKVIAIHRVLKTHELLGK